MNFKFSHLAGERLTVTENSCRSKLLRALGAYGMNLSEIGGDPLLCEFHFECEGNPFRGDLLRALGAYGVSLSEIGGDAVSVESVAESVLDTVSGEFHFHL